MCMPVGNLWVLPPYHNETRKEIHCSFALPVMISGSGTIIVCSGKRRNLLDPSKGHVESVKSARIIGNIHIKHTEKLVKTT